MAVFGGPHIIEDGLVLHLDAANPKSYPGSGNTWFDLSGNGNHGTLTNGPTYNASSGGYFSFDGTNDYVDCGNNSSVNFYNYLTISVWFNFFNGYPSGWGGILAKRGNGSNYGINYNSSANSFQVYYYYNYAFRILSVNVTNTFGTQQFYNIHTVFEFIGNNTTTISLYKNGTLIASGNQSGTIAPTPTNLIIAATMSSLEYGTAGISDVSFYNRALSADEIAQNFNAVRSRYNI